MSGRVASKFGTVMLIDDNAIDLFIACKLMKKCNFSSNIIQFKAAQEALDFLVDNQHKPELLPEIIFVDIYMPVKSGFDFLEEFEVLLPSVKQHCRVYVISSTIDEHDIQRANSNINVTGFEVKSITIDFLESIERMKQH